MDLSNLTPSDVLTADTQAPYKKPWITPRVMHIACLTAQGKANAALNEATVCVWPPGACYPYGAS